MQCIGSCLAPNDAVVRQMEYLHVRLLLRNKMSGYFKTPIANPCTGGNRL